MSLLEFRARPPDRGRDVDSVEASSDALRLVWARIISRIDELLAPSDRVTSQLLEGSPSDDELSAALEALDGMAGWIGDLGMVAAARLTRSLRQHLAACPGLAADGADKRVRQAVTAAGLIEDLRSSIDTTGAGGSSSSEVGDRLLVVGPPGLLVDSLIWFAATTGFTVDHSSDLSRWPTSPDAVVVVDEYDDGDLELYNPLLAARSAGERFAAPVVCVTHRVAPVDKAALAQHVTSLLDVGVRPADVVDEVRRLIFATRRSQCLAVRGDDSDSVVAVAERRGLEAWSAQSDEELLAGLEGGRASGVLLLPSPDNADLIRLLRVQPSTRRLVVVEVLDEGSAASSAGVDATVDSVDVLGRHMTELATLLRQRADLDVDLTPTTRSGGVPWASAGFLAERVLLAAHRADSVASLCVIRHASTEPVVEVDAVQDALMREFRTDDVVTRSSDRENILVLGGVDRQVARSRLEAIVERSATPDARVGIAEFPFDAQSVDDLVDAARNVLDRSATHSVRVVTVDWYADRMSAAEVLVADSDQASAHVVAQVVERCGMAVEHVADGQRLLDRLRDPSLDLPRLVVLDFDLLSVDGLTILRRLDHQGALRRFDVVMLSARTRESDIRQAFDLGVADVIEKPFSPGIVARRLLRLVSPTP